MKNAFAFFTYLLMITSGAKMSERGTPLRARFAAALIDVSPDWSATAASRLMGAAARLRLPRSVSRAAIAAYVRYFGVDLNDVDPMALEDGFETFDAFFTRRLRTGARSIDRNAGSVVSPCDGTLRSLVVIDGTTSVEAKGHAYGLADLLTEEALAAKLIGGHLASIYLHPRDYHRVHSPCDSLAQRVALVPGRLLPVTDASMARNPGLFAVNERMVHVLETGQGLVVVVMIAAFGVGNMTCSYQRFAPHSRELQIHDCDPPARLRKGDQLGVFHLGSTVLVLTEPGLEISPDLGTLPARVRLGEPLLAEGEVSH